MPIEGALENGTLQPTYFIYDVCYELKIRRVLFSNAPRIGI